MYTMKVARAAVMVVFATSTVPFGTGARFKVP